jgi:hypothetical protein
MTEDRVAAYLAKVRERARWTSSADGIAAPGATAIGSARDVPRLLAAVEAVRKHHWREETPWGPVCGGCWTKGGGHPVWPCMPLTEIVDALLGEGKADGPANR